MFLSYYEYEETMNYITIKTTCPECKSEHILHDTFHNETFCNSCGLILQDNSLSLITDLIMEDKLKEKAIRRLHYRKLKLKE
jgi:transcription initiation factor TFIIIB Brf1 subunit/transcription initiation factor TFIIB